MNIEESKNLLGWVSLNKLYIDTHNECDYHKIHTAIETLLTAYEKEKEKNKKAIKYCKVESTFQTFGDFELQNVLETYINRLKHRILDILEE